MTGDTRTRTYSKVDWDAAQAAWRDGEFSAEWKPWRHQAAMRGIIFPPDGTRWDGWDEDEPSQRALLIRAIRETPGVLSQAIEQSRSWGEVIRAVLGRRDDWSLDALREEHRERAARMDAEPNGAEAKAALTHLRDVIG